MVDMKHTREQLGRVMQRQINKTKLHVNIMLFSAADNFQEKLAWLVKSREGEVLWPYSESRWSYKLHFCVQKSRVNVVNIKQFSRSVMSDSLLSHGLQHAMPPCPSPTPGVHPNSCPLSRWCHPTISSSVIPFSSRLQSFPASGSFPMSQCFTSGGQSIGVSASASMNTQDWSPLGWTGWISLQSKGLSRVFSNTTVQKHQFFGAQLSL